MKRKRFNLLILVSAIMFTGASMLASCNSSTNSSASTNQQQSDNQITLSLSAETVNKGDVVDIIAKCGTTVLSDLTYSTEQTDIISIEGSKVTALKAGKATIKARKAGYKAGTITITVIDSSLDYNGKLEFELGGFSSPTGQFGNQWSGYKDTPVEEVESASSGKSIGYQTNGCSTTIEFTSSKAVSNAKLGLVMASCNAVYDYTTWQVQNMSEMDLSTTIEVTLNGSKLDLSNLKLKGTESGQNYYNWDVAYINNVALVEGKNSLVVSVIAEQGPNMDAVYVYGDTTITQSEVKPISYVNIGSYDYYVVGYEFGPGVNKAVVHLGEGNKVKKSDLSTDLFSVRVSSKSGSADRTISDIYLVDASGNKDDSLNEGTDIGFDLQVKVTSANYWGQINTSYNGASPFYYDYGNTNLNTWDETYALSFRLASGKSLTIGSTSYVSGENPFEVTTLGKKVVTAIEDWSEAKSNTYDGKTLTYKSYSNESIENDGVKNPLIIWLHGLGEGGTDPDIAILGNDVTNLGESKIQSYFTKEGAEQGAYVLAVQTPTMWMDDGTGANGTGEARSIYTTVLKDTIDKYLASNSDIDTSRIYLGGCSNGGYMTMNMAMEYPTFFAAYYPICEAYKDSAITDEDIATLKNLPIWLVASADDQTVAVDDFCIPTYKRLKAAGAANVHLSLFENVYGDDTGESIQYNGHWSWIYAFADKVSKDQADSANVAAPSTEDVKLNGVSVTLWSWLASFKTAE